MDLYVLMRVEKTKETRFTRERKMGQDEVPNKVKELNYKKVITRPSDT